jgi:hypothetical protein
LENNLYLNEEEEKPLNLDFLDEDEGVCFITSKVDFNGQWPSYQQKYNEVTELFPIMLTQTIIKKIFGSEVGDDRVDLSHSPLGLGLELILQEVVFFMKTSWKDTFITKVHWNFCETTNALPCDPNGSFDFARKTGTLDNLEFTDSPPLRIIIDSFKGDKSHSSTAVGKASMLGRRISTPRTEFKLVLNIASFMQDGMLRTAYSPDPKYIPNVAGGSNCPPLFGSADNLYLSVKAYKGGSYDRIYGTAINEAQTCLFALEEDRHVSLVLCRRLRDKQEYLHGTYANIVLVPNRSQRLMGIGAKPPEALFEATGGSNIFSAVENRLIRTRTGLPESDAVREMLVNKRIRESLFCVDIDVNGVDLASKKTSYEERKKFEGALQANSALQRLLSRTAQGNEVDLLVKEGFLAVNTGLREFSLEQAVWLSKGGKTQNYTLMDLTTSEALYARDEVTDDATMKVSGITLNPYFSGRSKEVVTKREIGLYEISETQVEWANKLVSRLKIERDKTGKALSPQQALPILIQDREWVNDDKLLIAECLRLTENRLPGKLTTVYLVSDDRRLANQMCESCNIKVVRLAAGDFIQKWRKFPLNSEIETSIEELRTLGIADNVYHPGILSNVLIDFGSIASAASEMILETTRRSLPGIMYHRITISSGITEIGQHRTCTYQLKPVGTYDPKVKVEIFNPKIDRSSVSYGGLRSVVSSTRSQLLLRNDWRSGSEATDI